MACVSPWLASDAQVDRGTDSEAASFSIVTDLYLASLRHLCFHLPHTGSDLSQAHSIVEKQAVFVYITTTTKANNLLLILNMQKSDLLAGWVAKDLGPQHLQNKID